MVTDRSNDAPKPDAIGQLIGEFSDVRGTPALIVGLMFGVPGVVLSAAALMPDWRQVSILGAIMVVVAVPAFCLGWWRRNNRVLVHTGGLVHEHFGLFACVLWQECQAIAVKREKAESAVGLIPVLTFRISCSAQQKNGRWIELEIPPISELAMKTIQESWNEYSMNKVVMQKVGQIIL